MKKERPRDAIFRVVKAGDVDGLRQVLKEKRNDFVNAQVR
jgi:hypothetical protein